MSESIRPGVVGNVAGTSATIRRVLRIVAGLALLACVERPAGDVAAAAGSLLDLNVPIWHFREVTSVEIHASPARVFRALLEITPREVRYLAPLLWLHAPESPLAGDQALMSRPMTEVASRSGFVLLGRDTPRELVYGAIGQYWSGRAAPLRSPEEFRTFRRPGYARVGLDFRVIDLRNGHTRLVTETRVHGTDAAARRKFGDYWQKIHPGRSVIRREWLAAIKRRAEKPARS